MRQDLLDSQRRLHDSLFELYMQGGFELMLLGNRGLTRDLIINLETSALTPEKGEIIHFYAVNRWDEDDEFDEWAKPMVPLSCEAERILGVTNEQLAHCRPNDIVLEEFLAFIDLYADINAGQRGAYGGPLMAGFKKSKGDKLSDCHFSI